MNKFELTHQPCPCGKSSDAYAVDHDGKGWCFSCSKMFNSSESDEQKVETQEGETIQLYVMRGHSERAERKYRIKTVISSDGTPSKRIYTYPAGWEKVRNLNGKKSFFSKGTPVAGLFGRDLFSAGSAPVVTIVEGEEDALSLWEVLDGKYPVLSVQNAAVAKRDCAADREYLNSFGKIILAFDNDSAGQNATEQVAGLFNFNKVYIAKFTKWKDANEYEINGEQRELRSIWYNAQRFLPEGIVSSWKVFDEIIRAKGKDAIGSYPFKQLNDATYGIRTGETVLIKAPEKVGKTEFIRTIEHHLLKTTDVNIGCIHIEESKNRQLRGLAGIEIGLPVHLPDTCVSDDEVSDALRNITKRDDRLHLYGHFGSNDPDLFLDRVRFLASATECKAIFFDHLSMVVSGLNLDDERKVLDYLSTQLAQLATDLDFALVLISHVNDDGLTRGSRNIAKVADLILSLSRNITSESPIERNTTNVMIEGNRFAGQTGPAGKLIFDPSTFMLTELETISEELPPV